MVKQIAAETKSPANLRLQTITRTIRNLRRDYYARDIIPSVTIVRRLIVAVIVRRGYEDRDW